MEMHITINLSEKQIRKLVETGELNIVIDTVHDIEEAVINSIWPDSNGYEPAAELISILRSKRFDPKNLKQLSKNRVKKLLGIEYRDETSIFKLEEALGLTFAGPYWQFDTDLKDLFPSHAANCLAKAGICTETDLLTTNRSELLTVPRLGRKSLRSIQDYFKNHNLAFT